MFRQGLWLAGLWLWAASPASADLFEDLWSQGRQLLEFQGITKPMFRSLTTWSEGQYYLGYCGRYLPDSDVAAWRTWWDKTIVPRSEIGRGLLDKAAALYSRGIEAAKAPPSKEFCRKVLDDWSRDMKAANVKGIQRASPSQRPCNAWRREAIETGRRLQQRLSVSPCRF